MRENTIRIVKLANPDEAFRAIILLMAGDKDYSKIPLFVAPMIQKAIKRQHYELLVVGNQAAGCVLWGEISEETLLNCVAQKSEPEHEQLLVKGDAIFAQALCAKTPVLVMSLWRAFVRLNRAQPILAIRHFGKYSCAPKFILYRDGRPCRDI